MDAKETFKIIADLLTGQSPSLLSGLRFEPPPSIEDPNHLYLAFDSSIDEPYGRACCSLNAQSDVVLGLSDLGNHQYDAGMVNNNDGYVYTKNGGIVDIGHVRDLADKTRFIAVKVYDQLKNDFTLHLEEEFGGEPKVTFVQTPDPPDMKVHIELAASLGARIAYELAIWHEIVTWFWSDSAFQKESAFSPEDNFSNLLGTYIGYQAILTPNKDYNSAVDDVLKNTLIDLGAMSKNVTQKAIEYVEDHWFSRAQNWKKWGTTYRRHLKPLPSVTPWLITDVVVEGKKQELKWLQDQCDGQPPAMTIHVPTHLIDDRLLTDFYSLEFEIESLKQGLKDFLSSLPVPILGPSFTMLVDELRIEILKEYPNGDKPDK
ncbi:MAG: DUF4056 domain-containing protein [Chloroflexota bacterium]